MKLAMLKTDDETLVVGVDGPDAAPKYVPLNWVDLTLPHSLRKVVASEHGLEQCREAFEKGRNEQRHVEGKLLAPIPDPPKIICIGLNYEDHATEAGMPAPSEPICFSKFGNTIAGPGEAIRIPRVATQVDYEAELVVVIGRRGYEIPKEQAFDYVAGYCNGHDVSARDWQINKPGKQWLLGKTPDTFAPIGPWLVTSDDVDPHKLGIQLRLNGQTMQDSTTDKLIFGVDYLVYLSQV